MPRLALFLLGAPRVELDGAQVSIPRRKALALLAFLAATRRAHSRDTLAALLWPAYDQSGARAELRRTLSALNRTLGTGWLDVDRDSASLAAQAEVWIDLGAFARCRAACAAHPHPLDQPCDDCLPLLSEAAALYRDDFLAGFSLPDSAPFEEWQRDQATACREELAATLELLARAHAARGAYAPALACAQRWLALDSLHEPAHCALIDLYARSGQRAAALRQYRQCARLLETELDATPAPQTTALYQRVRAEQAQPPPPRPAPAPPEPGLPPFLAQRPGTAEPDRPLFVARERELDRLHHLLDAALLGQGSIAFVTGEAGAGKTALLHAFARLASHAHPDLLVGAGSCTAFSGPGDPFLPFREALATLTGDVERPWAAGAIDTDQARRLWAALPAAASALLDHGPALIGALLPAQSLLARGAVRAGSAEWVHRLQTLVEGAQPGPGDPSLPQPSAQVAGVLRALAAQHPLLLLLDDLQWVDAASTALLFTLARALSGTRLLLLCAYRPDEVALERDGQPHPLTKLLAEVRRAAGDVWVELAADDTEEGQQFVDALLDAEPNRLGAPFRRMLAARTGGQPLFTVELLREMQARGDLVRDETGKWVEGTAIGWDTLPARIEAAIEERLARLPDPLRDLLTIASVEGASFTAQVVAQVQGISERDALRALSRELGARHRLVRELGETRQDGRFLSAYQFAHSLFCQHLYHGLSAGERRLLHGEVAEALEGLYAGRTDEIAGPLARHYAEAGAADKAVTYLSLAGDQARLAYAHQEAIALYQRALAFLRQERAQDQTARILMKLGLTYHNALDFGRSRQAYEEGFGIWQQTRQVGARGALPPAPHALRYASFAPDTLDPTRATWTHELRVIRQLFSGLVALGPGMEIVPDVAQRWEVSADGCRYVFVLREEARWSDGAPVTAHDFEYAWKRILHPGNRSSTEALLFDVKGAAAYHQGMNPDPKEVGIKALDERTLLVELERPVGHMLQLLARVGYPVPRHVVEAYGEGWAEREHLVTNGRFQVETWERDRSLVLARNPLYHGQAAGNVQRQEIRFGIGDSRAELEAYEANQADVLLLGRLTSSAYELARQRHAGEYVVTPAWGTSFVEFDASLPPFSDPCVRRAFALATDKEALAGRLLCGSVLPAMGGVVPPGIPGHSPGIALPYDPQQARRLLAEAGYTPRHLLSGVDLVISQAEAYTEMKWLRAQWAENLGLETGLRRLDYGAWVARAHRRPADAWVSGWSADYPDPHSFMQDGLDWVRARWQNPAYERLVETARRTMDQAERIRLYRQADRLLIEEAACIPLCYYSQYMLIKPWVTGCSLGTFGSPFDPDVTIEPH